MHISIGPSNINVANTNGTSSNLGNIASVNVNLNNSLSSPQSLSMTSMNAANNPHGMLAASNNLINVGMPTSSRHPIIERYIQRLPRSTQNTYTPYSVQNERGEHILQSARNLTSRGIEELLSIPQIFVQSRLDPNADNNTPFAVRLAANRHLDRNFLVSSLELFCF